MTQSFKTLVRNLQHPPNVKGACVLAPISRATHTRSEKFQKQTPPNMSRVNQTLNAIGNGPNEHQTL